MRGPGRSAHVDRATRNTESHGNPGGDMSSADMAR